MVLLKDNKTSGNLHLGFITYSSDQLKDFFTQFCEDNSDQIEKMVVNKSNCYAVLKDGTKITGIMNNCDSLRGFKFDQLILADDYRMNIRWKRDELIRMLLDYNTYHSVVPDEFKIIEYVY